jgi:NADH:ubiquinone oxidoreductase subunit K
MILGLHHFLAVSALLLALGLYGLMARRNVLTVLMAIQLIFNAANLNFAAFNLFLHPNQPWGQGVALFVIALEAAETVVGLALVLAIYRTVRTVLTDNFNILKG